jgi:cardiolipin synthase
MRGIFATYLLSHALSAATLLASGLLTLRVLSTRRSPQSVLAWLLGFVFLPPVAIPLYLLLGTRKLPRRTRPRGALAPQLPPPGGPAPPSPIGVQRVLESAGVWPARAGNKIELLGDGERAYARLMDLIEHATRSIHLSVFILGDDATGWNIIDALARRAKNGVEVKVILDAVGSLATLRLARKKLALAGAEARPFMPLIHAPLRGLSNLRSHRKLIVFDGESLFTGGMNLAEEYMGPKPLPGRWRDIAAVARGPVAKDGDALFASDWAFCGGTEYEPAEWQADAVHDGGALLQMVPSGPDRNDDALYDALLTATFNARERVTIVTPYYVPDDPMQRALQLTARRGVRTEVIVPARSNHSLADFARRSLLRELRASGVHVHAYPHGMVHGKAMVVDADFAYVGSPNIDMRSLYLNYENALFIYDRAAVAGVSEWVDALRDTCVADVPSGGRELWFLEQIARLLAPEL